MIRSQPIIITPEMEDDYWSKVVITAFTPCWGWVGSLSHGYGRVGWGDTRVLAHRFSWVLHVNQLTPGLVLDHICKNTSCTNPVHLREVTQAENLLAGTGVSTLNALKTHCKSGHEFTPENTYVPPKTGRRACRTCRARVNKAHYDALRKT